MLAAASNTAPPAGVVGAVPRKERAKWVGHSGLEGEEGAHLHGRDIAANCMVGKQGQDEAQYERNVHDLGSNAVTAVSLS